MNIGIFGGSFNPPHKGHEEALKAFIKTCGLDKVYVIPSFVSPHKNAPEFSASFEDRMEMCTLAFENSEAELIFSDVERELFDITGKKSYTVNTLERLSLENPYLFVGSDMFFTLDSWFNAEYIFKNVTIAVMSREDCGDKINEFKGKYEEEHSAKIGVINAPPRTVASTELRENERDIKDFTSDKVSEFIKRRGLYKKKKSREELLSLVKERLPEKRFLHTLSVEEEALFLADIFCPDFKDEISRGALLHDITKYLTLEEHKRLITNLDTSSQDVIHSFTGGAYARDVLLESKAVFSMIDKHTTADSKMSLFDMIIFVSDYIEKTRVQEPCLIERERLHRELTFCTSREEKYYILLDSVIRILDNTIEYLSSKDSYIHPRTINARLALRGKK